MARRDSTHGGRIPSEQSFIDEAEERGEQAGKNAASWAFADNQGVGYYEKLRKLHDDGDPAFDDYISEPAWLSGEWAGESIQELLGDIMEEAHSYGYDIDEDIETAYEEGATNEFWTEVHRVIEYHAGGSPVEGEDDFDDDDDENDDGFPDFDEDDIPDYDEE